LQRVAPYDYVLVDGRDFADFFYDFGPHAAIVDGDAKCYSIACASIVAKVTRDRLMVRLAARRPGYGWEQNVGYPTREHRRAIHTQGITPHHRRGFGTVRVLLQPSLGLELLPPVADGLEPVGAT
jgi:ribonuclease HII